MRAGVLPWAAAGCPGLPAGSQHGSLLRSAGCSAGGTHAGSRGAASPRVPTRCHTPGRALPYAKYKWRAAKATEVVPSTSMLLAHQVSREVVPSVTDSVT